MKIAVTGLNGLVGSRFLDLLKDDFDFIDLPQEKVDITIPDQVKRELNSLNYDLLLHLAAYTNVDQAEKDRELAWKINVEGTRNLYQTNLQKNKKFIYVSTDFVFDGVNPPFYENSSVNPLSVYGQTKYEGEKIVSPEAMIVRISYPYRAYFKQKKDFVRRTLEALNRKEPIMGVVDQYITLTFIDDIVFAFKNLFSNFQTGIFHIVGQESLTAYDSLIKICEIFNFDTSRVGKITYDEFYKDKAPRPKNSIIKSKKNNFFKMKTFEEGLIEIKKNLNIV